MARETTSKNLDGITDLVVVAPIREGFIKAYENITYSTRLQIVGEALHRIRQSAREHEFTVPFSDVTERILTLLDFRIGVLDQDLFNLDIKYGLKARRYLYLTATFDGAWEPYMRLIWRPLGAFLDLLFINCEGYVTAGDHDFPQYAQWVRDHQIDSAIFYSTTGLTVRDQLYLQKLDQVSRAQGSTAGDIAMVQATMASPEEDAAGERAAAFAALQTTTPDALPFFKIHELALEVLTVLFRLADYYPPEWMVDTSTDALRNEGVYLVRVAESLLRGWPKQFLPGKARETYQEPLDWYESGIAPDASGVSRIAPRSEKAKDGTALFDEPPFDAAEKSQVQAGILRSLSDAGQPVRAGALLLMTIVDPAHARDFLKSKFRPHYEQGEASGSDGGFFRSIAFTAEGLRRIGMHPDLLRQFPKEFREGMASRAGLIGDVRANHPRRWTMPARNWPPAAPGAPPRPPVGLSEIDFVIQLRFAQDVAEEAAEAAVLAEIARIAALAEASGLAVAAYEPMISRYEQDAAGASFIQDNFGFRDGISQPDICEGTDTPTPNQQIRLGELLCGYANDRGDLAATEAYFDTPPANFDEAERAEWDKMAWRRRFQKDAARFQHNGSYLVIRKIEQHPDVFEQFLETEAKRISTQAEGNYPPVPITPDELAACLLGRNRDGSPLIGPAVPGGNAFDYEGDPRAQKCPFAAHARRANPRKPFQDRPNPRIMRRGMSYQDKEHGKRGLLFQCYNSSIAEQYEAVQRWLNGGNITGISAAQNDPLTGVGPKKGDRLFRFEWCGRPVRVRMPEPFVALQWGLYLFTPSRAALETICAFTEIFTDMDRALENRGRDRVNLVESLPEEQRRSEWKRLLEDFKAKDPAELNEMPDMWSAIRYYGGGSYRVAAAAGKQPAAPGASSQQTSFLGLSKDWVQRIPPEPDPHPIVLTASYHHALQVLGDWKTFSVEEQLSRIVDTSGSIYVTQQPDDQYNESRLAEQSNYHGESEGTNEILFGYSEEDGFNVGYAAGAKVLTAARDLARGVEVNPPLDYFKLELRRQYIMPALGLVCSQWFGLPDAGQTIMRNGGWNWHKATDDANPDGPSLRTAQCPGDCLSPSRGAFYPQPTDTIKMFAHDHGRAIKKAGQAFVDKYVKTGTKPPGSFAGAMFDLHQKGELSDDGYARNLIGIMVGAMPPMDGNLRGVLVEWLGEATLWRHQGAYLRAQAKPGISRYKAAREALYSPMARAMCKRPAPDLIYRRARKDITLAANADRKAQLGARDVQVEKDDTVIVSLVSVAQRSLRNPDLTDERRVSIIFGGDRIAPWQGEYAPDGTLVYPENPVHACPAKKLAMGAMLGILAALLDAGEIQALPASLILKIKWLP